MKQLWLLKIIFLFAITTFSCRKKESPVEETGAILSFKMEAQKNSPLLSSDVLGFVSGNKIDMTLSKKIDLKQVTLTIDFTGEGVYINNIRVGDNANKVDIQEGTAVELRLKSGKILTYFISFSGNISLSQINITTENNASIISKTTYIKGSIDVDGKNSFTNYKGSLQIKGRGNTSWGFPKKPYRLKLDAKSSLFNLASAKDWVLLANYLDGTHTLNAVGMKIGQLLKMPFTNTIIPIELTLNGQYQGLYMLTELIEVQPNRVNVGTDGTLLQMDTNFDDEWKFRSKNYQLPVMIGYPQLTNASDITPIQNSFEQLESLMVSSAFPNNNYLNYIDENSIVNYLIAYMLTDNQELNHPKSTYLHKTQTGKYNLGPIWDFDWAFSYEKAIVHFYTPNNAPFWTSSPSGTRFFSRFTTDPRIKTLLKQRWGEFRDTKMPELLRYIDDYAFTIEAARQRDYQKWQRGNVNFKGDIVKLKTWLQSRANFLTGYINNL